MAKRIPFDVEIWNQTMDKAFGRESDRGAALLVGAVLDNQVAHLLREQLVQHEIADKLVFGDMTPLSSFKSRIDLAFALGLITHEEHKALDLVRKIRNRFAHHPQDMTFTDDQVTSFIEQLASSIRSNVKEKPTPRSRFSIVCAVLAGRLARAAMELKARREAGIGLPFDPFCVTP